MLISRSILDKSGNIRYTDADIKIIRADCIFCVKYNLKEEFNDEKTLALFAFGGSDVFGDLFGV